jgi:hypothetical protein
MALIKLNNRSIKDVTSLPFGVGNLIHIQSQTASNSASISFTTGINSTYKEYQFYFIDIHPRTDAVNFTFNMSTDSGSNYNVTKTTTAFLAEVSQSGTFSGLSYQTASDLAQSTSDQRITTNIGSASSESAVGYMSLFNPASTTYVKHFISTSQFYFPDASVDFTMNMFVAGYGNTTSAINAVRFQMSSGNFDGTIAMFGVL